MIHIGAALFLLLMVIVGLVRIIRGPTVADRMMGAQLLGTCGLAILLALAQGMDLPELIDIALAFSLLATLATMTFVRRTWYEEDDHGDS